MITITSKSRYAVQALAELARQGAVPGGQPVPIAELARRRDIPLQFLEQLFATLRRGGLLQSQRGVKGGYSFVQDPGEVTVLEGRAAARRRVRRRGGGSRRARSGRRRSARCATSSAARRSPTSCSRRTRPPARRCTTSRRACAPTQVFAWPVGEGSGARHERRAPTGRGPRRILAVQIDDEPGHLAAANVEQLSCLRPHLPETRSAVFHAPSRVDEHEDPLPVDFTELLATRRGIPPKR